MARYSFTILCSWILALTGLLVYIVLHTGELNRGLYDTAVLGAILGTPGFYTLLSMWGIGAEFLSRRGEELRRQPAIIRKTSWHYRLNNWVGGENWTPPSGECQYWPATANSVLVILPFTGAVVFAFWAFITLVRIAGWFLGYVPDIMNFSFKDGERRVFYSEDGETTRYRRQRVGPAIVLFALVAGIALVVVPNSKIPEVWVLVAVFLTFVSTVFFGGAFYRLSISSGRFLYVGILGCGHGIASVLRWVFSPLGGLGSYALMRLAGLCRQAHYVD